MTYEESELIIKEQDKNTKEILKVIEKEKCELLGFIQGKDKAIKELQEENEQLKKEKYHLENLFKEAIKMYGIIFQGKEADGNWYDVELVPFIPCLNTEDDFRIKPNTQIADLEKQIEKMKCCANCTENRFKPLSPECDDCRCFSKWRLKE